MAAVGRSCATRGVTWRPSTFGIVLGTGLSSRSRTASMMRRHRTRMPGPSRASAKPGVSGHAGQLVTVGEHGTGAPSPCMQRPRSLLRDRPTRRPCAVPLETLAGLGCTKVLVLTNSAGSMHSRLVPGQHGGDHRPYQFLTGVNPLIGVLGRRPFRVRSPRSYDRRLRDAAAPVCECRRRGREPARRRVHVVFRAVVRDARRRSRSPSMFGADLVGMSTVPEAILARWLGMRVAALSVDDQFRDRDRRGAIPATRKPSRSALSGSVALRRILRAYARNPDLTAA